MQTEQFYMTCLQSNDVGYWVPTGAGTLSEAKRAALSRFQGVQGGVIQIALGDGFTEPRVLLAARRLVPGGEWVSQ